MHLGNVFSALMAWLSAKSQGGELVLRIEDLDPDRCRQEYAETLKEDLEFLGLTWDWEQTPQSQRTKAYTEVFEKLQELDLVYPCYCSRAELHAASAPHASDGAFVYSGACRNLTANQRREKEKAPAWRLKVADKTYAFLDILQGEVSEHLPTSCGDFIIRRADGVYAYQLAVVTDDIAAGVTEVVRGKDLLLSTPRQMYLYDLMGAPYPRYCHVPLLVDDQGRRLSKRDGDLDLGELRKTMTAEEIIGRLAHAAGLLERFTPVSAEELAQVFSWDKVKGENIVIRDFLV